MRKALQFINDAIQYRRQWHAGLNGWFSKILARVPAAEERTYRHRLLGLFVASRTLMLFAGVWFDQSAVRHGMHLIDSELLQHNFWQSLWYQHIQPPFFNMLTALTLLITPNGYEWLFLWPLFLLLGWLLILGLYRLMRGLGIPARLAFTVTVLFSISPAMMYFGSWYAYSLPITVGLVWSVVYFMRWMSTRRSRHLFLFFTLMLPAVGMHTLFLWLWMVLLVAVVLLLARGYRAQVLLCGLLPVLVCLSFPAKNYYLYGTFSASSWSGLTLGLMVNTHNPDYALREKLYAEGKISALSLMERPETAVENLPPPYNHPALTGIQVLDDVRKANGDINFNNATYLKTGPVLVHDAITIFKANPWLYVQTVQNAFFIYVLPLSDYFWLRAKTLTLYWDWAWNLVTAGRIGWSPKSTFLHLSAPPDGYANAFAPNLFGTIAKAPWYLVGWFNFLIIPGLIGYGCWLGLRGVTGKAQALQRRATLMLLAYNVIYVTAMSVLFAISENHRYRFYISPFLAVYFAMAVQYLLVRYRNR
ncbi:MAG TPA: hypothetical protein VHP58_01555 [Alphaproteobacteria bacterium]|nr:hypothetical protein [Alphaproteobacteria bacterium]